MLSFLIILLLGLFKSQENLYLSRTSTNFSIKGLTITYPGHARDPLEKNKPESIKLRRQISPCLKSPIVLVMTLPLYLNRKLSVRKSSYLIFFALKFLFLSFSIKIPFATMFTKS